MIVVSGVPGAGKTTVAHLVAAAFERSVHLQADGFLAAIVSGRVDPSSPEATAQHEAVGGALAVSAMGFAGDGYTTVVDGYLFPDGVAGLAAACADRGLECHYVVLWTDPDTGWARASARDADRGQLERDVFSAVHAKFAALDLPPARVVDASGPPDAVRDEVLSAYRDGRLRV